MKPVTKRFIDRSTSMLLTIPFLLLAICTNLSLQQIEVTSRAESDYFISEYPMEYKDAAEFCTGRGGQIANVSGETAYDACSFIMGTFNGPITSWCNFSSLESLVNDFSPVFEVWNDQYYSPCTANRDDKNYVLCQKKSVFSSIPNLQG